MSFCNVSDNVSNEEYIQMALGYMITPAMMSQTEEDLWTIENREGDIIDK